MTDLAALEAQKKTITDEIAALSNRDNRHAISRPLPSSNTTKLAALNRQLATINLKLKQAAKAAG